MAKLKRCPISRAWGGGLGKLCLNDSDGLFPAAKIEPVEPVLDDSVEAGAGVKKRLRAFEPAAVMLLRPSWTYPSFAPHTRSRKGSRHTTPE